MFKTNDSADPWFEVVRTSCPCHVGVALPAPRARRDAISSGMRVLRHGPALLEGRCALGAMSIGGDSHRRDR